ncbi:MAG: right-handed parallel beta-helix repeat-containing protein [Candidatus Odinarchaeia archaeon]
MKKSYFLIVFLAFSLLTPVFMFPSPSSQLIISTDTTWSNMSVEVYSNIVIQNGATLTIQNATVYMRTNSSTTLYISVQSGGALIVNNSIIQSNVTIIGSTYYIYPYTIRAYSGSTLVIENSELYYLGLPSGLTAERGIYINTDDAVLRNNILKFKCNGIYADNVQNLTIEGNTIQVAPYIGGGSSYYNGTLIYLYHVANSSIVSNHIEVFSSSSNVDGIVLRDSNYNRIAENTMIFNIPPPYLLNYAIRLEGVSGSKNNIIYHNSIEVTGLRANGIQLTRDCDYNNITQNAIRGIGYEVGFIIYSYDSSHLAIQENAIYLAGPLTSPSFGIYIYYSTISTADILIKENIIMLDSAYKNVTRGISFSYGEDIVILNNTVTGFDLYGLYLSDSQNIDASYNIMLYGNKTYNTNHGFYFNRVNNSKLSHSTVITAYSGAYLWGSDNITLTYNTFKNCTYGARTLFNSNATFYMNNFERNDNPAVDFNTGTTWDNGTHGNYWSDWSGSGVYNIPSGDADNHPLTQPTDLTPPSVKLTLYFKLNDTHGLIFVNTWDKSAFNYVIASYNATSTWVNVTLAFNDITLLALYAPSLLSIYGTEPLRFGYAAVIPVSTNSSLQLKVYAQDSLNNTFTSNIITNWRGNGSQIINAYDLNTQLTINTSQPMWINVEHSGLSAQPPLNHTNIGAYISITSNITSGFTLTIRVYYSDIDVQNAGLNETELAIYFWNTTLNQWVELPSTVNTVENYVETTVTHLTVFAIFGPEETESPPTPPAPEGDMTLLIVIISVSVIAVIGVAAAIYFTKLKK